MLEMTLTTLTWKFYRLAIDDEVRELRCNLPAFFFVLRKVKLLSQFHVIDLSLIAGGVVCFLYPLGDFFIVLKLKLVGT